MVPNLIKLNPARIRLRIAQKITLHGEYHDGSRKTLVIPRKKIFDIKKQSVLRGENQNIGCDQPIRDEHYPYRSPVKLRSELLRFVVHD